MQDKDLMKYRTIYNDYWQLFKKYAQVFGSDDAYWQSMLHEADAIYQSHITINKEMSYSMAIATVQAVECEWKRARYADDDGRQLDFYDLERNKDINSQ